MRTLTVLLSFLALVSCDSTGLVGPDFEQQLVHMGGCGDVIFYAVDDDDELMLSFITAGLVEQARTAGEEIAQTFTLPDQSVTLSLKQGTRVSDVTCDDVAEQGGPQVRRSWTATAGSATVTVRPIGDQEGAMADLLLENVTLTPDASGRPLVVERMEWKDVYVGWYAG